MVIILIFELTCQYSLFYVYYQNQLLRIIIPLIKDININFLRDGTVKFPNEFLHLQ